MPQAVSIDTKRAVDDLIAAGLEPRASRAIVTIVNESVSTSVAATADLRGMRHGNEGQIRETRLELRRQFAGPSAEIEEGFRAQARALDRLKTEIIQCVNRSVTLMGGIVILYNILLAPLVQSALGLE